jgi:hypothetical protein
MPLRKAIDDLRSNTLAALPGRWLKILYFSRLRRKSPGKYSHWGFEQKYGNEGQDAMRQAHASLHREVLHAPIKDLIEDAERNEIDPARLTFENEETIVAPDSERESVSHFRYIVATMKVLLPARKRR